LIRIKVLVVPVLLLIVSCDNRHADKNDAPEYVSDLDDLRMKGKIVAVTDFNSTNYFIYHGTPMGFHYELLKSFSSYIGVDVEIIPCNDINESIELLNTGEADILAASLAVNNDWDNQVRFTSPVSISRQVLIQRKPNRWSSMGYGEIENSLIRNPELLTGKTVYVQTDSNASKEIHKLSENYGGRIEIIEVPFETEKIISLVARREIDYAVCDENIALVNSEYYPIIDVATAIDTPCDLAWGVRKNGSEKLLTAFNEWLTVIKENQLYSILYSKYFTNGELVRIFRSDFYTLNTGKISPWDKYIKIYSDSLKWDWRLLASLIYQESRFRHDAISLAGAYGLMQVLPSTGESFGIDITSSPVNNIKGGVLYLRYLQKFFENRIPDENERLKFILAAYNAGEGNILDAMKLAEKYGRDPLLWDNNVEYFLLKKSDPQFYNDPVVQFGYCRGSEPVAFVSEILERYSEYCYFLP